MAAIFWGAILTYGVLPYAMTYVGEPHTRNVNVGEPHTRNVNVGEPHTRNVNVGEPHTRNVNVSEPHTRNVNVGEPHTRNVNVSEPHTRNVNVGEQQVTSNRRTDSLPSLRLVLISPLPAATSVWPHPLIPPLPAKKKRSLLITIGAYPRGIEKR